MEGVLISLVITTYNRAAMLADALKSVAASQIESYGDVEVIVVDNNSTDNTRQTVEEIKARGFPFALRYVFERSQGLSYARNRGAEESAATYVAFMDDDQLIDKDYLARLELAFESTEATCIGGPLIYRDKHSFPGWLLPLLDLEGECDFGSEAKALGRDQKLRGGNMAFVRQELIDIGKYDVSLGRCGDSLLSGEEDELQIRLHESGRKIAYDPGLVQYHCLLPSRLKKRFWREHHFGYGRSLYRMRLAGGMKPNGRTLFGAPLWLWRVLLTKHIPKTMWPLMRLDTTKSFYGQLEVWTCLGQIHEARHWTMQQKGAR